MNRDEMLLRTAVQALQADEPEAEQVAASARRVAGRLGIDIVNESRVDAIASCDDVQHLFGSYRAGTLSSARSLLIEAHLRDCSGCRRQFKGGSGARFWTGPLPSRVAPLPGIHRPPHGRWLPPPRSCSHLFLSTRPIGRYRPECAPRCNRSMGRPIESPIRAIAGFGPGRR